MFNREQQWKDLKSNLSKFSVVGVDGQQLKYSDNPQHRETSLRLGEVAAQLIESGNGQYLIRFGVYDSRPSTALLEELNYPQTWELRPSSLDGNFIWLVDGRRYLPQEMSRAITAKLEECCEEFKAVNSL